MSKTKHCATVCMIPDVIWWAQLKSETCLELISRENENLLVYTDFINGRRTVKNWYLVMKMRPFRINNFRVTSDLGEFVRLYRVLKIFFIEQGVCFIFLVQF